MERTLILNAGSSSVKFRLYAGARVVLDGIVDRIGDQSVLEITGKKPRRFPAKTYREAGLLILSLLENQPARIVHRVVHGGQHTKPVRITPKLVAELTSLVELAPLHMPPALSLIKLFGERTGARQIACFDTMFHRTMPAVAKTYAIPRSLSKKHKIEHYGFHGMAHEALARETARRMKKPLSRLKIITCQLGNGASVCAIRNGKSVDTSMGFTPLEGLVMGTRSGDIDPAIIEYLCESEGMTVERVMRLLETQSGLLALGGSNDVRDLLEKEQKGNKHAKLALDLFAYRTKKTIGAYIAALNGVDAIVLGGGISRAPVMRVRILSELDVFGIKLDRKKMVKKPPVRISSGNVQVWVFEVDEQEEMRRLAMSVR